MVSHRKQMYYAHRVIYFLKNGDTNQIIRHSKNYDNHAPLLAGTQAQNIADKNGIRRKSKNGYKSKFMTEIDGELLSCRQAAAKLGVPYTELLAQLKSAGHSLL